MKNQSPEDVVSAFIEAVNAHDLNAAAACVLGGRVAPYLKRPVDFATFAADLSVSAHDVKSVALGDRALVTFHLETANPPGILPMNDFVVTRKTVEGWQIEDGVERGGLGMLVYFLSDPKLLRQAYESRTATSCLQNAKRVVSTLSLFSCEGIDFPKLTPSNWRRTLIRWTHEPNLLTCMANDKRGPHFSLNERFFEQNLFEGNFGVRRVVVYEGKNRKLDARHKGKGAVGFSDTGAKLVTPEEFAELRWE